MSYQLPHKTDSLAALPALSLSWPFAVWLAAVSIVAALLVAVAAIFVAAVFVGGVAAAARPA